MDNGLNDYLAARHKTSVYADQISVARLKELEDQAVSDFCKMVFNNRVELHPPLDYKFKISS